MRKIINYFILPVLLVLVLAGCATPYQENSWWVAGGGYQQTTVNRHIEKIEFFGNSRISAAKVQRYTLFRCAEYARENGSKNFFIYNSLTDAASSKYSAAPQVSHTGKAVHGVTYVALLKSPIENSFVTADIYQQMNPETAP